MQVLTIPQPFAQLVVRGARQWMVRAVPTDHRGPLAIHASSAVPSHDVVRESRRDPTLAAEFASQGWREREDLLLLPRGSVVGVVRLVRVTAIEELGEEPDGLGEVNPGELLLEFADAVEISPVGAVRGKSAVWTLPDDLAAAVTVAEGASRARPSATAGPGLPFDSPINFELAEEESEFQSPGVQPFWREETERRVAREIARYLRSHKKRGTGERAEVRVDHRLPYFRRLFRDRAWVGVTEFETLVRDLIRKVCGLPTLRPGERRRGTDRYEDYFALLEFEELPVLYEADDGSVVQTGFTELDLPRRRRR